MGSSQSLIEATLEGNEEAMLELLEDPKTLEEKDEQGNTALHHACTSAQEGPLKLLLDRGADYLAKDCVGNTPLHKAVQENFVEGIRIILKVAEATQSSKGASPFVAANAANNFGITPLMHAATWDAPDCAKALLEFGAQVNISNPAKKWNTIHYAAIHNSTEVAKMCLDWLTPQQRCKVLLHKSKGEGKIPAEMATSFEMQDLLQKYQQQPVEGEEDMSPERMSRSSRLSGRRRQSGARGEEAEGEGAEDDLVKTKNKSTWWRSPFRSPSPSTEQIAGEVGKETWMAKKKEILNEENNSPTSEEARKEEEQSEDSGTSEKVKVTANEEYVEKEEVEGKGKGKLEEVIEDD